MEVTVTAGPDLGFEEWVAARVPALMRFAYLVTGTQDDAEEAVQSALAAACEKWQRVSRTQDPDAYVRRMIANAHVSQWRRFGKRMQVADVDRRTAPDHAERVSANDAVWRVCATLPRQQRAAVVLRFYEDLEYGEIARVLDVTEATARSHVSRALAALRDELGREQ